VDGVGYLDDAIAHAEKLANITPGSSTVTKWYERPTLFPGMSMIQSRRTSPADLLDAQRLRTFVNELGAVELMYLRP